MYFMGFHESSSTHNEMFMCIFVNMVNKKQPITIVYLSAIFLRTFGSAGVQCLCLLKPRGHGTSWLYNSVSLPAVYTTLGLQPSVMYIP